MNYLQQIVIQQERLQAIVSQLGKYVQQADVVDQPHSLQGDKNQFSDKDQLADLHTQITALETLVHNLTNAQLQPSSLAACAIAPEAAIATQANPISASPRGFSTQSNRNSVQPQNSLNLIECVSDGFLMIDRNWQVIYLNARASEILQRPAAALIGKHFWSEFPDALALPCHHEYHRVLQEQVSVVFEEYYPPLNIWLEVRAYPIPEGIASYFLDISDRKQAEDQFSLTFHSNPIGMAISRYGDGCFLDANESFLKLVDYSRDELIGHTSIELGILQPDERQAMLNLLQQPSVRDVEWKFHTRTGKSRIVRIALETLNLTAETRLLILAEDVTEYCQMQIELQDREARLQLILENMPVILNAIDEEGKFVMWNQEIERVTGYTKAEILGRSDVLELLYPDHQERHALLEKWATIGGAFRNWEITLTSKDGSRRVIAWSNLSKQFPIAGWMSWAVGIDVTERVIAEQERQLAMNALSQLNQELEQRVQQRTQELEHSQKILQQQQWQFRSLVDNIPDIVVRMDRQLRHLYINRSVEGMTGLPAEDFIGKSFREMGFPEAGIARVETLLNSAFETGEMRSQVLDLSYNRIVFDVTVVPEPSSTGQVETILVIWRDVTQLKQAEQSLRAKEQQFRTLAENAPDIILRFDRQYRHLYANPRFEALIGISAESTLGKTNQELGFPPEIVQRWEQMMQIVFETGCAQMMETDVLTTEGLKTFHSHVVAEVEPTGIVSSVLVVARDITNRKQTETNLQYAIERLEQLNNLKDDFLSTVSHELRTPVSNIKLSVRMLELAIQRAGIPSEQQFKINQYLRVLNGECEREIHLINDLLDLQRLEAGQQTAVIEAIDLQPWLERFVEPFRDRTRIRQQTIEITTTNLPSPFRCDVNGLERIMAELFNNACKYTPPGERIVLHVSSCPIHVEFSLTNYGVDIPPEQLPRIFEKFYRVPSADPWKQGGTGLGLALVKKLADYMRGSIEVESGHQHTCFCLRLPHLDPSIAADDSSP